MSVGTGPANRFGNPDIQFADDTGLPYAGGLLYFYASGSSTPQNTYNNADLDSSHANTNPIVLDSAGRAGTVFLQALSYKVTLTDADGNLVFTQDPVYTSDYSTYAQFFTYAGNPNGNVAGTAGSGTIPSSVVWDRTNDILYVCTTSGNAASAVWTQVTAAFTGSISFTSVITPTALSGNTNDWAPTGFATTYAIRSSASSAVNLTGLAGGASGRDVLLENIGTFVITLKGNSGSSTAANRFLLDTDVKLNPTEAISLWYDTTSSGWRSKAPLALLASGADQGPITGGASVTTLALGSLSGVTITLDVASRPMQSLSNNGAGTLAPGSTTGYCLLEVINTTGAGAITTSGFTKVSGDSFDTTTTSKFVCSVYVGSVSLLTITKIA